MSTITPSLFVPAELRYLEVVRVAVRIAFDGCDPACSTDLQLATDELAGLLISSAEPDCRLRLCSHQDDHDAYVRMSVPAREPCLRPAAPELTHLLLTATTDSYDLAVDDEDGTNTLVGVLQRGLKGRSTPPFG